MLHGLLLNLACTQTPRHGNRQPYGNAVFEVLHNFRACPPHSCRGRRPKTFVAACGVQPKQSGVVTVNVPVAQHHPRGSPLESIALYCYQQRYRHRAGHMPRWEAHGLEAWLAGAGAALADVLLVWLDGPEPGAGKPGAGEQRPEGRGRARGKGAGEDAEVGALGLRLHLIRRADVGSEALKAIVGLVTGW